MRDKIEQLLDPSSLTWEFVEHAGNTWLAVKCNTPSAKGWDKIIFNWFGLSDWRSPSDNVEALRGRKGYMMVKIDA